jgi:hypothetical protein
MRQRTAENIHTATYLLINDNTFHPRSSLHFTSLTLPSSHLTSYLFTTHHSPFFTSLHLWTFRHHSSPLIITVLTVFLKICNLQGTVVSASAASWFHRVTGLFTQQYSPISVVCYLALILRS